MWGGETGGGQFYLLYKVTLVARCAGKRGKKEKRRLFPAGGGQEVCDSHPVSPGGVRTSERSGLQTVQSFPSPGIAERTTWV